VIATHLKGGGGGNHGGGRKPGFDQKEKGTERQAKQGNAYTVADREKDAEVARFGRLLLGKKKAGGILCGKWYGKGWAEWERDSKKKNDDPQKAGGGLFGKKGSKKKRPPEGRRWVLQAMRWTSRSWGDSRALGKREKEGAKNCTPFPGGKKERREKKEKFRKQETGCSKGGGNPST